MTREIGIAKLVSIELQVYAQQIGSYSRNRYIFS